MKKVLLLTLLLSGLLVCSAQAGESGDAPLPVVVSDAVFQAGAFSGPQAIPGETSLMGSSVPASIADAIETAVTTQSTVPINYGDGEGERPSFKVNIKSLSATANDVAEGFALWLNSHPEHFYILNAYSYAWADSTKTTIGTIYIILLDNYSEKDAFDAKVEQLVALADGLTDPLELALFFHDYLVEHVYYNKTVIQTGKATEQTVFSAYGAIMNGDAVCQGYAQAYKLLLNNVGVDCFLYTSDDMNHAWNGVWLDESSYHVDATWDDPTPHMPGGCNHTYFLRSDSWMTGSGEHSGWAQSTACTSTAYDPDTSSGAQWIFNSSNFALYRDDEGQYYYLSGSGSSAKVYQADALNGTSTPYFTPSSSDRICFYSGIVWDNGSLYYISCPSSSSSSAESCTFRRLDLADKTLMTLASFTFPRIWNGTSTTDGLGLSLDPDTRILTALSSDQWLAQDDPEDAVVSTTAALTGTWATGKTSLVETTQLSNGENLGLYWNGSGTDSGTLYQAWYTLSEGVPTLAGLQTCPLTLTPGSQWFPLPQGETGDSTAPLRRFFLLTSDGTFRPLGVSLEEEGAFPLPIE